MRWGADEGVISKPDGARKDPIKEVDSGKTNHLLRERGLGSRSQKKEFHSLSHSILRTTIRQKCDRVIPMLTQPQWHFIALRRA